MIEIVRGVSVEIREDDEGCYVVESYPGEDVGGYLNVSLHWNASKWYYNDKSKAEYAFKRWKHQTSLMFSENKI